MRKEEYTTVKVACTFDEAVLAIGKLRQGGVHPAELALTTPLVAVGAKPLFPIEVPAEEAQEARKLLTADQRLM